MIPSGQHGDVAFDDQHDGAATIESPSPVESPAAPAAQPLIDAFDQDKYLLKQKWLSLTEKYSVFNEQGEPVLFVRREAHHLRNILALLAALLAGGIIAAAAVAPATILNSSQYGHWPTALAFLGVMFALVVVGLTYLVLRPKRHIGFFTDATLQHEVLTVFQDHKLYFLNATYTLADADLNLLGWFRKNYLWDLFRKRWYCYDSEGQLVCAAMEDSVLRSILRRLLGQYGASLIITNFIFVGPGLKTKLGEFNRRLTLLDSYVLDMTSDPARHIDRRMAVALGVLLDTGERR